MEFSRVASDKKVFLSGRYLTDRTFLLLITSIHRNWNHNIPIAPSQFLNRWTSFWQIFFNHITYFQHLCLLTFHKVAKSECSFLHQRNAQSSLFTFLTGKSGETIFQRMLINYEKSSICFSIFCNIIICNIYFQAQV